MSIKMADFLLLCAAALWGSGFIGMKYALDLQIPVYTLLFYRFIISSLLLAPILFMRKKEMSIKLAIIGSLCGFVLFVAYVFQTYALYYTSPSKNAFYTTLYVIIVPFLYWIFIRKRPNVFVFLALIPTTIGIAFLSLKTFSDLSEFNFGDFLTVVCALIFGIHIMLIGYYNTKYDPLLMTFFQMLSTAAASLVFMFFFDPPDLTILDGKKIMILLYLAFACTLLAFSFQNLAQKYTTQSRTAICMSTESVFGALFSVLFGFEVFKFSIALGGALIVFGVIILETKLSFLNFMFKGKTKNKN